MVKKGYIFCIIFMILSISNIQKLYAPDFDQLSLEDKARILHRNLKARQLDSLRQILIQYPLYVDITNDKGESLLSEAVHLRMREGVEMLLSLGADVNLQHPVTHKTAIYRSRDPEITRMLVSHPDIDLKVISSTGRTILMEQLANHRLLTAENIHVLLTAKVDVNTSDPFGYTALHYLFSSRYYYRISEEFERQHWKNVIFEILKDLIKHKADVNARTHNNVAPLHLAAKINHVPAINLLVESNADMDVIDNEFQTPAMLAYSFEALDAAEALVALKAKSDFNQNEASLRGTLETSSIFAVFFLHHCSIFLM